MRKTIQIPFPAWNVIFDVESILGVLRQEPLLAGIPAFSTPRRITISDRQDAGKFDDILVVELWVPGGGYVTSTIGGARDKHYGTHWSLLDLRVRYKNYSSVSMYDMGHDVRLRVGGEDLASLSRAVGEEGNLEYARSVGSEASIEAAELRLAEARRAASITARRLAEPVARVILHREVRDATEEAGMNSTAFCWLKGEKPYSSSAKRWTWGKYAHWDEQRGYEDHNDPNSPNPVEYDW